MRHTIETVRAAFTLIDFGVSRWMEKKPQNLSFSSYSLFVWFFCCEFLAQWVECWSGKWTNIENKKKNNRIMKNPICVLVHRIRICLWPRSSVTSLTYEASDLVWLSYLHHTRSVCYVQIWDCVHGEHSTILAPQINAVLNYISFWNSATHRKT